MQTNQRIRAFQQRHGIAPVRPNYTIQAFVLGVLLVLTPVVIQDYLHSRAELVRAQYTYTDLTK